MKKITILALIFVVMMISSCAATYTCPTYDVNNTIKNIKHKKPYTERVFTKRNIFNGF